MDLKENAVLNRIVMKLWFTIESIDIWHLTFNIDWKKCKIVLDKKKYKTYDSERMDEFMNFNPLLFINDFIIQ